MKCQCTLQTKDNTFVNDENTYNHNFSIPSPRYCICDEAYDPETEEEIMIQCLSCDDWFHEGCMGGMPSEGEELVCALCIDKHDFAHSKLLHVPCLKSSLVLTYYKNRIAGPEQI